MMQMSKEDGRLRLRGEFPHSESRIKESKKHLEEMNQEIFGITRMTEERMFDRDRVISDLKSLKNKERESRWNATNMGKKMGFLKRNLDKLTFANNAYKDKAIKTVEGIDIHKLHFQILHRTNSSAEEKKLLREINARQRRRDVGDAYTSLSLEEIDNRLWHLHDHLYYVKIWGRDWRKYRQRKEYMMSTIDEKQVLEEMKELEWAWEKGFANATVKGKTWDSLPSKQVIKDEIKIMEEDSDKHRKRHMEVRVNIRLVEKELKITEKAIDSLKKQLENAHRKKDEEYESILKLRKLV